MNGTVAEKKATHNRLLVGHCVGDSVCYSYHPCQKHQTKRRKEEKKKLQTKTKCVWVKKCQTFIAKQVPQFRKYEPHFRGYFSAIYIPQALKIEQNPKLYILLWMFFFVVIFDQMRPVLIVNKCNTVNRSLPANKFPLRNHAFIFALKKKTKMKYKHYHLTSHTHSTHDGSMCPSSIFHANNYCTHSGLHRFFPFYIYI